MKKVSLGDVRIKENMFDNYNYFIFWTYPTLFEGVGKWEP